MSNKIQDWAWKQPLKAGPKLALMALADESNDQGMVFLGRSKLAMKVAGIDETAGPEEVDNAARVLRRHINVLIEENYMMTGRRQRKWSRGRAIDVIFLNVRGVEGVQVYDSEDDVPGQLPNPFLLNKPVDNSENVLPDNLSGKRVSPSQDLGDNLSGKSYSETNPMSYRTKTDVLPDKNGHEKPIALKGTRARINPLNNPSVSPVLNSTQEPPVEKTQTDGLTDGLTDRRNSEGKFSPITSEPISPVLSAPELPGSASEAEVRVAPGSAAAAPQPPASEIPGWITRGVNHATLRRQLHQAQLETTGISEELLAQMIAIVFSRATQPVRSPQRFAYSCIAKEFYELLSLAQATFAETQDPVAAGAAPTAPKRVKPSWCQLHNREYTSAACPVCSNPRIAALEEPQNSLLVAQTPKEDPPSGTGIPLKRP